MLAETSRKGVLDAPNQKYSAAAYHATLVPICKELNRQKQRTAKRPHYGEGSGDPAMLIRSQ